MNADRLREAARVLRERAEAAKAMNLPQPWQCDGHQVIGGNRGWRVVAQTADTGSDETTATYIATMHPGVGLALADWLELVAAWRDEGLGLMPTTNLADAWHDIEQQARKVADLILGDPS